LKHLCGPHFAHPTSLALPPQPKEDKYRKIKLSNEKVHTTIVQVENALDALRAMGWVQEEQELEFLVLPAGKYMSMKEVSSAARGAALRAHPPAHACARAPWQAGLLARQWLAAPDDDDADDGLHAADLALAPACAGEVH
jgi:hypothetical protein